MPGSRERGPRDEKVKKIGKLGSGGLPEADGSCQAILLRRTASYIWLAGRKLAKVSRKLSYNRTSQQEANRVMLYKESTGHVKYVTDQAQ